MSAVRKCKMGRRKQHCPRRANEGAGEEEGRTGKGRVILHILCDMC